MTQFIAQTTIVVKDYDEAIRFYVDTLGFDLIEDTPLPDVDKSDKEKRWVVVAPTNSQSRLLLAEAATDEQRLRIGDQTGGRVFMFLYTDDFWRDYKAYAAKGVQFVGGEPREEAYGTVVVFKDICGNLWDLIQPASAEPIEKK